MTGRALGIGSQGGFGGVYHCKRVFAEEYPKDNLTDFDNNVAGEGVAHAGQDITLFHFGVG